MIFLELSGKPVPWTAPHTRGKFHYNPKHDEKELAMWQLKTQYRDVPIGGPIHLDFTFFFPIPKSASRIKKKQMLAHLILPTCRPDTTNLQKFYEDCLTGIVITDDALVTDINSRKRYSDKPGILIKVMSLWEKIQSVKDGSSCE